MEVNNLMESNLKTLEHGQVGTKPVDLDNLYPALVECFGIIFLGYIAGRQAILNFTFFVEFVIETISII
jgi:hypothetical protein